MPKSQLGTVKFYGRWRGYQSSIPKPVIEILGEPDKIKFVIQGNRITISKDKND